MVRYGVAAMVGCLYVIGSVWLIHGQGESYREALRQKRVAAVATEPVGAGPSPTSGSPSVGTGAGSGDPRPAPPDQRPAPPEEPSPSGTEPVAKPSETTPPSRPAKPANAGLPPSPSPTAVAETKPAPVPLPARPAVPPAMPAMALDPNTGLPNLGAFWEQPALTKSWDLAHLKPDDEFRLGQELHDLILQFNRPLETGSWQRRVEEAAEPFLKDLSRKDIRYTFTILDSNAVDAFSTPGGFVYVSRGLFNLVGEDEDYALEFAVGHEIAHVDLGHALKCLQDPGVMNLKAPEGTLQKLYMLIIPFAYLDPQEYQADAWAYRRMKQRLRTDRECLAFLRKLDGFAQANGFYNGRAKPGLGRDSSPIENHLRAHTAAWKRLKELAAIIGKP
jgi:hypothetical protein